MCLHVHTAHTLFIFLLSHHQLLADTPWSTCWGENRDLYPTHPPVLSVKLYSSLIWSVCQCCCLLSLHATPPTASLASQLHLISTTGCPPPQWRGGVTAQESRGWCKLCYHITHPAGLFLHLFICVFPPPLSCFFSPPLWLQVNCNGFTIEDEELSHLGSAVFPE